jgi:hypothetical protein
VPEKERADVWERVLARAPRLEDGRLRVTASLVDDVVKDWIEPTEPRSRPLPSAQKEWTSFCPDGIDFDYRKAACELADVVHEHLGRWPDTYESFDFAEEVLNGLIRQLQESLEQFEQDDEVEQTDLPDPPRVNCQDRIEVRSGTRLLQGQVKDITWRGAVGVRLDDGRKVWVEWSHDSQVWDEVECDEEICS